MNSVPGGEYQFVKMHVAETGAANGLPVVCTAEGLGGITVLVVQIVGVNGDTLTFEATVDGANWVAIQATNLTTAAVGTTAGADGLYRMTVVGLESVRVRISNPDAGTIYVTGIAVA